MQNIQKQAHACMEELLEQAESLKHGDIIVIGCSTSAVLGNNIGSNSSIEIAKPIMDEMLPQLKEKGLFLAVQCCEHLNRSLVVERTCMERYRLSEVCVKPWLHAGGAFAMQAMERFDDYVIVEDLKGLSAAGIDIGGTFIGMHLRSVVVPVRTKNTSIGLARVTMARTRPKYVGGPRAQYDTSFR